MLLLLLLLKLNLFPLKKISSPTTPGPIPPPNNSFEETKEFLSINDLNLISNCCL